MMILVVGHEAFLQAEQLHLQRAASEAILEQLQLGFGRFGILKPYEPEQDGLVSSLRQCLGFWQHQG
jgi:hypothetical protein